MVWINKMASFMARNFCKCERNKNSGSEWNLLSAFNFICPGKVIMGSMCPKIRRFIGQINDVTNTISIIDWCDKNKCDAQIKRVLLNTFCTIKTGLNVRFCVIFSLFIIFLFNQMRIKLSAQKSKWNENEIRYEFGEIGNKRRTIKNEESYWNGIV